MYMCTIIPVKLQHIPIICLHQVLLKGIARLFDQICEVALTPHILTPVCVCVCVCLCVCVCISVHAFLTKSVKLPLRLTF
jgi:hypothetical protein